MNVPLVTAVGVCHRDAELACLWLRWVGFLDRQCSAENSRGQLLVVYTRSVDPRRLQEAAAGMRRVNIVQCPDEMERGYPGSASHLFLRTLEGAEKLFPGHAVLWCEVDCWPLRPSWESEIRRDYQACGRPFFGAKVGKQYPHLAGNSVYPPNWRLLAPTIAGVLDAPDLKLWGPGKGQPWDVYCRGETTPQMAESKLWHHVWKDRSTHATRLADIPAAAAMFHQDKTGAVIRELATAHYPEFMDSLPTARRFFVMNGNTSRLRARGVKIEFSYSKFVMGGWRSAVCSDELSAADAQTLATLVGRFGVREVDEAEFLRTTGRNARSLERAKPRAVAPLARTLEIAPPAATHPNIWVMLGRYGDLCNILPLMKAEADAGRRPTLVVAQAFADILDGVSYVDRIVWEGEYDRLPDCLRWLRRDKGIGAPMVCQYHRNPYDKARLTSSYQTECWRLAGKLDDFATRGPLVFDQRDPGAERIVVEQVRVKNDKPLILVGLQSVSSPLGNAAAILSAVTQRFSATHNVFDLSSLKTGHIYHLIGLMDAAACLVTSDTVFLHLSRASQVGVVGLLNDGWRGSVPHENVYPIRYAEATPERVLKDVESAVGLDAGSLIEVCKDLKKSIDKQKAPSPALYHAVDLFGGTPRHLRAQATWKTAGLMPFPFKGGSRNAKTELGDPRALPFLKDVLWAAIPADSRQHGDEIVVWSNDDIGFAPGFAECVRQHVGKHHAAAMRRRETNGHGHPGRDVFAFTVDWLHEHWAEIPDYVLGAPVFDLGLVALIRRFHGLPALTLKSCNEDFPPADMPSYATHESHTPEWSVPNMDSVPSVLHNRSLFRAWAKKYAPETRFSKGGNLK